MAVLETPGKMYALAGVLSALAILAVILRFYSRRLLKAASIGIDDLLILPALVFHVHHQLLNKEAKHRSIAVYPWDGFLHAHW